NRLAARRVYPRAAQRVGAHRVIASTAFAEVSYLKVARRFVEAERVEVVVRDVHPVKEVGRRSVARIERRAREVERKIECPIRSGLHRVAAVEVWVEVDAGVVAFAAVGADP